jgi:hypothetical protein
VETEDNFRVSSPEYCFLQMAASLSLIELIQLGFEFCGSYGFHGGRISGLEALKAETETGFFSCQPLTSVAQISRIITRLQGSYGSGRALQALNFIADASASPMETVLTILLSLPYRYGGYGFALPLLNHPIDRGLSRYRCDLYWPKAKLAVEYDSDQFHTGADRIAQDSIRRNTLALLGIEVVTVTWQQIRTASKFREVAFLLSKRLGKRLTFKDPQFTAAHLVLKSQLLRTSQTPLDRF